MGLEYSDILERYPSSQLLGKGGQKVVFAVEDPEHGRCVLKVGAYRSTGELERARREVGVLRDLCSAYYPRNLEFRVLDDRRFLVLEELIEGKPLGEHFGDFRMLPAATRLVSAVVSALRELWERRVVHRDLKPGNILVTPALEPRIVDLGIARVLDMDSVTRSYALHGPCTPAYAAPEQLANRKDAIDPRTDQFSLGVVYGQLLLGGDHPFDPAAVGSGADTVANVVDGNWARRLLEAKAGAQAVLVLERMLGGEPYKRFRSPSSLLSSLERLLEAA